MNSSTDVDKNSNTQRPRRQESSESEDVYAQFASELCYFYRGHVEDHSTVCTTCPSPDSRTDGDADSSANDDADSSTNDDADSSTNDDADSSTNDDAYSSTNDDADSSTNDDANSSTNDDADSSTQRTRRQESSDSEGDYLECFQIFCSVHHTPVLGGYSTVCPTCLVPDSITKRTLTPVPSDIEDDYLPRSRVRSCVHRTPIRGRYSTGPTTCPSQDSNLQTEWHSVVFDKFHTCLYSKLVVAIYYKREDIVNWLLKKKHVNPNYNIDKRSPIGCAVRTGHLGIVKLLLEAGVNVESVDSHGGKLSGYSPVHVAACKGSLQILQLLVSHGASINKRSHDHLNTLYLSTLYGDSRVVKWLLSAGAIVNVLVETGMSSLHAAASLGHTDICRLLIEAGAYPSFSTIDGWTALNTAVSNGQEDIVKLLLEAGADISCRIVATGDTLLHTACIADSITIVRLLLRAGVPIESKNSKGNTPLLTCAGRHDVYTAFVLLKAGASVNAVNNKGMNALGLLINNRRTEDGSNDTEMLMWILLKAGARLSFEKRMKDTWLKLNHNQFGNLLSLQEMCHVVVRQALAPDLQKKACELPLPPGMKRAIALNHLQLRLAHPDYGPLVANVNDDDVNNTVYSYKGLAFNYPSED